MPSLKKKTVLSNMKKKGFCAREGDHTFLYYKTTDGKMTGIRTKVSHSSSGDIHSGLVCAMAKQCYLKTEEFVLFANCKIDQIGFEQILQANGVMSRNKGK